MTSRMAYNPLSFVLTAEGFKPELAPPLPEILSVVRDAGYDGIHSDIPAGMTPRAYLDLLNQHSLLPAPGYFQAQFDDREKLPATIETARRLAADHAQLGLDRIFIAEQFGADPRRIDTPAQGIAADDDRLSRIADGLAQIAQAMAGEGIVPCLHAHVGTRIETVEETEFVLDRVGSDILLVGPDTGHLSWAGADLVAFLGRHAGRVGAVHIKDYRREVADRIAAAAQGYHAAGAAHIWTEPGRGSIDLEAALAALGGFDGWFVVEVDIADQPTVPESARVAAQWLRPRLDGRRTA